MFLLIAATARVAHAQNPEESDLRAARRAIGLRGGEWRRLPYGELYFQRGLAARVGLENSAGVWQRRQDDWHVFVIPLLTSLKFYPLTTPSRKLEPFLMGGIGFALGIEKESIHAIGGGGTTIITGFGMKGATGVEYHVYRTLTAQAGVHYLYMRFNNDLGGTRVFEGAGAEGGLSYRLSF